MNHQLAQLTESFTIALADRVRRLKADGVPIVALQTGDPDFHTPPAISEVAYQAMLRGATHYSNSRGLPALRQAVAERVQRECHASYSAENEILITHGAIHGYHVALKAILNDGDAVLVPDPSWQTHANMVKVVGSIAIRVPSSVENDFFPTIEQWQAAITPQTRALVINTPNNPTGMVASRAYLEALLAFAIEHDLYIISDEVYDSLLYGVEHVSLAGLDGAKERVLLVNSLSKTYAMTGWRVGYLCAPQAVIDTALKASQHTITNVAEFIQHASIFALTDPAMQQEITRMREAYAKRRELVLALYDGYGETKVGILPPQGAFYFFLDVRPLGISSNEIAERLLNEAHVSIVPGSAYGESGEGFIRMTIAASEADIRAGFLKILDWAKAQG